jgi:hypothetical protein
MKTIRLLPGAIALTAFAVLAPGAASADAAQAKAAAAQHAGLAAASGDLDGVRRHLHHVLNCLVGPDGEGFDESAGNPCAQAGGAIPQTDDAAMRDDLMAVADEVRAAIMGGDLAAAQAAATELQGKLE